MRSFVRHKGLVVPLDRADIDTDQIIPKQFMKRIERTGFGQFLFYDWRYLEDGRPNPNFILNAPQYQGATILLARRNFGCGSSREHAPIAIKGAGVSCIIAESFARIFFRNAINIGLPILESAEAAADAQKGDRLSVDLVAGTITNHRTGKTYQASPYPPFVLGIINAGGLVPYTRRELGIEITR